MSQSHSESQRILAEMEVGIHEANYAIDDLLDTSRAAIESLLEHDKILGSRNLLSRSQEFKETVTCLLESSQRLDQAKEAFDHAISQLLAVSDDDDSSDDEEEGGNRLPKPVKTKGPDTQAAYFDALTAIREENELDVRYGCQFSAFQKLLEEKPTRSQGDDVEEVISRRTNILVDPLTKKPIENAVKNKTCGHVYDKKSFLDYLGSRNPKCPYMGCANRTILNQNSVEEDTETNDMIQNLKTRSATQRRWEGKPWEKEEEKNDDLKEREMSRMSDMQTLLRTCS